MEKDELLMLIAFSISLGATIISIVTLLNMFGLLSEFGFVSMLAAILGYLLITS